jgi:hypothetical protein
VNDRAGLSGIQRVALIVGAIAILVVAYVLIQGAGDDEEPATTATQSRATEPAESGTTGTTQTATTQTETEETPAAPVIPTVRVVDAKPQGGVRKLEFDKGEQVRFRVVSDTADHIHVHGYDLMKDVRAGGSVTFSFKGSIDGRFEVELEDRGEQIAELDVAP